MISIDLQKITDSVQSIADACPEIEAAIKSKGGSVSGGILSYASSISGIPTSSDGAQYGSLITRKITSVDTTVRSVGSYAFKECIYLQEALLPAVTSIGTEAFKSCRALIHVDMPSCLSVDSEAFFGCTALNRVTAHMCSTVYASAFRDCTSLTDISLPKAEYIYGNSFNGCTNLRNIHIGTDMSSVCRLFISNAFDGCTSLQRIYVPSALVTAYKSATNWVNYASLITGE